MYNRYIRNDDGSYSRIPEEDGHPPGPPPPPPPPPGDSFFGPPPPLFKGEGFSGTLRRLLDKLHLESIDSGDLILLLLMFFLFREEADEELLIALGLLLIL